MDESGRRPACVFQSISMENSDSDVALANGRDLDLFVGDVAYGSGYCFDLFHGNVRGERHILQTLCLNW